MAEKRMCPHCGGQMFMVKIVRAGIAETTADGYKILKESQDKFDIEVVGCARCRQNITEADLVEGVKCTVCGKIVTPTDVNSEGVCNVCEAVKQREELANASREDLIKMLLAAEKKANHVTAKMDKQIAKAESIEASSTVNDTTEDTNDSNVTEKKPRTKTRKKKGATEEQSTESPEEVNVEENNTEEPVIEETTPVETEISVEVETPTEAVEDIANQQEAPFPNVEAEVLDQPEEIVINEDSNVEPVNAGFQMFDDSEEAF